jgi:sorbose reductase
MESVLILSLRGKELPDAPRTYRLNKSRYIATDMNLSLASLRPELLKIFCEAPPLRRVGTPQDVELAVLYLLSGGSSYVTGQDLAIDGGMQVSSGNYKL